MKMTEQKTRVRYGAGGAMYYEKVKEETPKKEVISEIFDDGEAWNKASKPKKKKKVIQEVFADNEDL